MGPAVGKAELIGAQSADGAVGQSDLHLTHSVAELSKVGARIHTDCTAHRAGDTCETPQPTVASLVEALQQYGICEATSSLDFQPFWPVLDRRVAKVSTQLDDDATDACIGHQEVGAVAQHRDGEALTQNHRERCGRSYFDEEVCRATQSPPAAAMQGQVALGSKAVLCQAVCDGI